MFVLCWISIAGSVRFGSLDGPISLGFWSRLLSSWGFQNHGAGDSKSEVSFLGLISVIHIAQWGGGSFCIPCRQRFGGFFLLREGFHGLGWKRGGVAPWDGEEIEDMVTGGVVNRNRNRNRNRSSSILRRRFRVCPLFCSDLAEKRNCKNNKKEKEKNM